MFLPGTPQLRLCGLSLTLSDPEMIGGQETSGVLLLNPGCLAALRQGRLRLELSFSETALATASSEILTQPPVIRLRVSTNPVPSTTNVLFTARLIAQIPRFGEVALDTAETTLTLKPPQELVTIASLSVEPNPVVGPQRDVAVTITLNRPAPPDGTPFAAYVAGIPNPILSEIPPGQISGGFRFTVPRMPMLANLPILVYVLGSSRTVLLRVGPA
jgi:hypothetical protein